MVSVNDGLVPEMALGGRLSHEPSGDGSPGDGQVPGADVGEGGCYRVHAEGEAELSASQCRLWRRLFRVLEDPLKPIVLIDGGTISLFSILQQVQEYAESRRLRSECNYVVVVPGDSKQREELIEGVRHAVAEGELYGQCVDFVLDEYEAELPTMVWYAGRSGGVVLTDNRSLTPPSQPPAGLPYRLQPVLASEPVTPARLSNDRTAVLARTQPASSPGFPADLLSRATESRG